MNVLEQAEAVASKEHKRLLWIDGVARSLAKPSILQQIVPAPQPKRLAWWRRLALRLLGGEA